MKSQKTAFRDLPKSLRYGLTLVIFSWFFFLITHSAYSGQISIFHITMGMFVCYALYSLKNWGRFLAVAYDAFMAFMIGFELYHLIQAGIFTSFIPFIIKGGSVMLFIVSSIPLLTKETGNFYKKKA